MGLGFLRLGFMGLGFMGGGFRSGGPTGVAESNSRLYCFVVNNYPKGPKDPIIRYLGSG